MRKILCLLLCAALLIPAGCGHADHGEQTPARYALLADEPTDIETFAIHGFSDGIITLAGEEEMLLADAEGYLIPQEQYDFIYPFEDGRAKAQRKGSLQWVYINTQLEEIASTDARVESETFKYDSSETTDALSVYGDYLYGIMDRDGKYLTEPIFQWIASTVDDYNFAILAEGEHPCVMISPQGEVLATLPDDVQYAYRSGDQIICEFAGNEHMITDLQGKVLNSTRFSAIGNISEGLRVVIEGDKMGLMDETGDVVLAPSLAVDSPYDYIPFIWYDRIACIKDNKLMMVTVETYDADGAALPRGLHGDVSPADLTDEQAQELMRVLMPRQIQTELLFSNKGAVDYSQPCPLYAHYKQCADPRFHCVQDIRDYISATVTQSVAQQFFETYLDSAPDATGTLNEYIDYNGKLYRNVISGGKGVSATYLVDTARIVGRTDDAVTLEMNTRWLDRPSNWVYTPTLVKTADGWRVDNTLDKGYNKQ